MGTYDDLQSQINHLDDKTEHVKDKIDGIKANTELDAFYKFGQNWKDLILGRYLIKVEGPTLLKIIMGCSDTQNIGLKGEYIKPLSAAFVFLIEQKLVLGWVNTKIVGSKTEIITGAKTDILHGIKFEKKSSESKEFGAAGQNFKDGKGKVVTTGTWAEKFLFWKHDVKDNVETIAQLDEDFGTLEQTITTFTETAKEHNIKVGTFKHNAKNAHLTPKDFEMNTSGALTMQVTGNFNARSPGGSLEVRTDGSALRKKGGAFVACNKSKVIFHSNGSYLLK